HSTPSRSTTNVYGSTEGDSDSAEFRARPVPTMSSSSSRGPTYRYRRRSEITQRIVVRRWHDRCAMNFGPYRRVLAVPGVRALLLVGVLARIPATAIGMTLTLHVVTALGRSWAQAGLVTAAFTIGGAVGAPLLGRLIDRRGLRMVMVLTTAVSAV